MTERTTGMPVRSLQTMLRQISELDAAIPAVIPDGIYGRDTRAAVAAFQRTHDLPVTGVTDLATWEAIRTQARRAELELAPAEPLLLRLDRLEVFAPGAADDLLWPIQGTLAGVLARYENAPTLTVNGVNDNRTQTAVRWIQARAALPQTGALDRQTWRFISRLFSLRATDGRPG